MTIIKIKNPHKLRKPHSEYDIQNVLTGDCCDRPYDHHNDDFEGERAKLQTLEIF